MSNPVDRECGGERGPLSHPEWWPVCCGVVNVLFRKLIPVHHGHAMPPYLSMFILHHLMHLSHTCEHRVVCCVLHIRQPWFGTTYIYLVMREQLLGGNLICRCNTGMTSTSDAYLW